MKEEETKMMAADTEGSPIELLYESTEEYVRNGFEIAKLKAIDKSSSFAASLLSRLCWAMTVFLLLIVLNIGVGIWLGELLGKPYYGFFIEAVFYLVVSIIFMSLHSRIKARVSSNIITQILN